jgi:hypothetical protein
MLAVYLVIAILALLGVIYIDQVMLFRDQIWTMAVWDERVLWAMLMPLTYLVGMYLLYGKR